MLRSRRTLAANFVAILIITATGFILWQRSYSTTETSNPEALAQRTAGSPQPIATPGAVFISAPHANDSTSAPHGENSQTLYSLQWTFGGKAQSGWYLYAPLIGELINSGEPPTSLGFAAALAQWQGSKGLVPTGIIDEETLMRMVKAWQEVRSADRTYPTPDQLITAPSAEFYDPQRAPEMRQLERRTYLAYKRLLQAAIADRSLALAVTPSGELAADEKRLRIISAFRSREYQERLRRQSPHSGRAGLAVNSPHFTGRALDLYIAGEPVETKDNNRAVQVNTSVYRWLVRNAKRFGFRPYFYEPWHWEYDPALDSSQQGDGVSVK